MTLTKLHPSDVPLAITMNVSRHLLCQTEVILDISYSQYENGNYQIYISYDWRFKNDTQMKHLQLADFVKYLPKNLELIVLSICVTHVNIEIKKL